ncbi:Phosphomannomutase [Catenulispora acidiphila DSM 44928]|uniref:Phosphomannomutase n=1 Tax=Catenulispora acidiphila (strain DSM 44928 / JCM 14897 / NBRC 102108 / NRRL B-24433 / ID139908) TaxID=479433 RepID=C7QCG5_CATAD|nr:phosphomannomutase/phosphoglucomutase [Catenulispora acidiphila]ACU76428.1 Phosphomannomutase [Catenulispora acidiphila DSM 44928]
MSQIVKAYDVRGVVPDQLDETDTEALGAAFAEFAGAPTVVVGHDMRPSSPDLAAAFARGAASRGVDVVQIGLASTDLLYFASGALDMPGAMFTASHNPAKYNGIKMCKAGAAPIGQESGLVEIRQAAQAILDGTPLPPAEKTGTVTERAMLDDYAAYLNNLVDLSKIRPLKVVVDAANGMGGYTVPTVFKGLPLEVVDLYFELDGTFPNHEANPLDPKNLVDLQRAVVEHGADLGLAFDGDADRCFVVDERGEPVSPSTITALVAVRELAKHPGATIIHNLITSAAVPEIVREHGGVPARTRVGHSFIKQEMASTGAVFGGEHSAHYYFQDFWKADTGMLAAMHVLAALGEQELPLSELAADYTRYASSGEINSEVADQAGRSEAVREEFGSRPGVTVDELDGLTVTGEGWWFNVRPSNTEPLLRLNIEAADADAVAALRDEVLAVIRA